MRKKENDLLPISESLKAIAHPDRLNILTLLGQKEGVKFSVSQICEKLKLNQPEVSRHLSILKNKGVLAYERAGSNIYYSINRDNIAVFVSTYLLSKKRGGTKTKTKKRIEMAQIEKDV